MTIRTPFATLIGVALIAAAALVVIIGRRQLELTRAYTELRAKASLPYRGYAVPTFRAGTLGGDSITVGELPDSGGRQVVFVFTTTCQFCKATLPIWAAVADSMTRLGSGTVRVVAISLDSAAAAARYATEHHLSYPVLTFPHWKTAQLFRARAVPETVVLNQLGEVVFAHIGRLEAGPALDSVYLAARGGFDAFDPRPPKAPRVDASAVAPPPSRP